jgi:hypothetical protein
MEKNLKFYLKIENGLKSNHHLIIILDIFKIKITLDKYFPKYKVYSLKANIFSKPNKKTKKFLPFGSKIEATNKNKNFIEFEKNQWLKKKRFKKN